MIDGAPATVVDQLDVRPLPDAPGTTFRAPPGDAIGTRLFGGRIAGQAMRAASLTVDQGPGGPEPASMRASFLRPGRAGEPVDHTVEPLRDGRSFADRRVTTRQGDTVILTLEAGFHRPEPGDVWEPPSPVHDVAPPDACPEMPLPPWRNAQVIDMRPAERGDGRRAMWIRVPGPMPDDVHLHASALAYVADMGPVGAVVSALGFLGPEAVGLPEGLQTASLDHCLWFHRPARADGWLLYELDALAAGGARGVARGSLWTEDGHLAATVVQEVLVRRRLR